MNIRYLKTLALIILAATASLALADPPGRVGRISYVQGDVSFFNTSNDDSFAAQINWPVTSQNLVATGRDARTEIRVGSAAVRIDSDSELEVTQLDDQHFNLRLIYGSVYVRIKDPELAKDFSLFTSQGRVLLSEPSRLRIDSERAPDTTSVSVLDGMVSVAGTESTFTVRAGKRAELANSDIRMATLRPNDMQDNFDMWAVTRDQRDDQSQSVRYVSRETTGYEDLDRYGNWETTSEYGAVWYPRAVAYDWAPYRVGRWTWVDPWGWTWVDSAPWGYAPFHYGRWVWFHQRWCWAPGTVVRHPVWAPAMVGWVGGANWSVSFSSGTAPAIGWFPLAPHEVYVPSYRVSPTYVRQVNITHVTNINNVTVVNGIASVPQHTHYQNREVRNAVSLMPHDQFVAHRTVVVSTAPERINTRRALESAPVSAVAPASIAHPNGFARDPNRERNVPHRPAFEQGQSNRFNQPVQPAMRESVPPAVRLPMQQERNEPRVIRNSDAQIERRIAPSTPPTTQLTAPPSAHMPAAANPDFSRRNENHPDRRIEPPNVFNPVREAPHVAPQPNPAQEAERERARQAHEAQRQAEAEAQARALREQQNAQPHQVPLKQAAPPAAITPSQPVHEERRHHQQENAPAEIRREERQQESKRDAKEGGRYPDTKENPERR
ncbi:MAG TPA: DUF6600 domain-containing protein [Burkholderiaceae bacterium]